MRFTVTDAGDPVRGARVTVGGADATTDGRGRATVGVKAGRVAHAPRARATATAAGFEPGRFALSVR